MVLGYECKGTMNTDEVPCIVFLDVNTTVNNCDQINFSVYHGNTSVFSQNMTEYNDYTCNSTFSQTQNGTYNLYFSTGDTGSIILEGGNMMVYLLYFGLIVIVGLLIIGFMTVDYTFNVLAGMLMLIYGLHIIRNGFNGVSNTITLALSYIVIGIGGYIMLRSIYEYSELSTE